MLRQGLHQKLLQKLSPQQIQLMKLLQLPTTALEERIKEEIEINPALEEGNEDDFNEEEKEENLEDESADANEDEFSLNDYMDEEDDSYKLSESEDRSVSKKTEIVYGSSTTLQDILESQLGMRYLNERQLQIADYILGNIDEEGYLRRELDAIVDDLAFSQNIIVEKIEVESLLKIIQEFDPAGVGARNLEECLLLQLRRKSNQSAAVKLATEIISNHMDEFSKKHYDKIIKKLNIEEALLKSAIQEIVKLNPRPGSSVGDSEKNMQQIVPDFIISNNDGRIDISINSRNAPDLRVSRAYAEMLQGYSKGKNKASKEASSFVKQKIEDARWFIDAIKQRQQTLLYTMKAIVDYQYEFFLEGDETKLKPMILKDIAERIGLDISTISRVANSKYVQTHFGTFLLKTFFSESLSTDSGEEVSTREVKKILEDCILGEDKKKPLTDDHLTKILKEKGYNIARRTVSKYREQLNIPVARMRVQL